MFCFKKGFTSKNSAKVKVSHWRRKWKRRLGELIVLKVMGMNLDVICDDGDDDTEEGLIVDEDTENQSKFLLKDK